MHRRGIIGVGLVVFIFAVFLQLNRLDILPKIFGSRNINQIVPVSIQLDASLQTKRESFLLLYDPTSVYSTHGQIELKKYLTKLKRRTESRYFTETVDFSAYKAVIVHVEQLSAIPEAVLERLSRYVASGGSVYLSGGVDAGNRLLRQAGVASAGTAIVNEAGVRLYNNAFIGAGEFSFNDSAYSSNFLPCSLTADAKIFVKTYAGSPLLWERSYGKGKYVVFNSDQTARKNWRGVFAAGLSRLYDDFSYPIICAKVMFIDDFSAPVPEGRLNAIYNEFNMNMENFYRYIWWPDMLGLAASNNVKYTGLIIQSYNDRVKPPFIDDASDNGHKNLVAYGRELLKSGGELGIHGYNHQPLAMEGYNQEKWGYNVWDNPEDMRQSLTVLKEYIEFAFPYYRVRTYVPAHNILSPEGRDAINRAFPSVNIFSSLYSGLYEDRCLYQDFDRHEDGSYDIPRVSAGFEVLDDGYYNQFSSINAYGIFSHFVNSGELYYEKEKSWSYYKKSLGEFTRTINNRYPWLRASTTSETANYMDTYYDFDYVTNYLDNGDLEFLTNGMADAYLVFRTTKEIASVEGCALRNLGDGAYLLRTENVSRCLIRFKKQ